MFYSVTMPVKKKKKKKFKVLLIYFRLYTDLQSIFLFNQLLVPVNINWTEFDLIYSDLFGHVKMFTTVLLNAYSDIKTIQKENWSILK